VSRDALTDTTSDPANGATGDRAANGTVDYLRDGPVADIVLRNPGSLNALTDRMYEQLLEICGALSSEREVRVVIVRGSGRAFCAGTDIESFTSFTGSDDGLAYERQLADVLAALSSLPMPVIAAVRGPAFGAGLALMLCCDIAVATPDTTFGVPIARTVGNCLAPAITGRLYASIGRSRALAMLMSASVLTATEAMSYGLIAELVPELEWESRVRQLAQQIAGLAPLTLAAMKETDRRLLRGLDSIANEDLFQLCYGSKDFAEGVAAFQARRPARWQHR
jgi:enoyl-CoA hydratase/carnithine racemase